MLEHVCFSTIIGFATGRQDASYAKDQLASAARLLLREGQVRSRGDPGHDDAVSCRPGSAPIWPGV